ncbi:ArsC family reductase [Pantoea sp. 1.19]|uniref:ArsC family reductase n=1 Tax=Pantoea sp. 1.19 TaxID=1925589 RepID=UPI000948F086|nr:ArsC family reductase [Pantoea sp. 1.19]
MSRQPATLYGIKNCDTIKKARNFLRTEQIDYRFHDYRSDGLDADFLQRAIDVLGWQALLNTRGTTWRQLPEAERAAVDSAERAKALMLAHPAMIKRPLLCGADGTMLLGFNDASYHAFFQETP